MPKFNIPELDKKFKIDIVDDGAQELMVEFSIRNGKHLKTRIMDHIWARHDLPTWRGRAVEEVPFTLRIDQIAFDFTNYKVSAVYRFLSPV